MYDTLNEPVLHTIMRSKRSSVAVAVVAFIAAAVVLAVVCLQLRRWRMRRIRRHLPRPRCERRLRVALCISGQIRPGWRECAQAFQRYLIGEQSVDTFMCVDAAARASDVGKPYAAKRVVYVDVDDAPPLSRLSRGHASYFHKIYECNRAMREHASTTGRSYDVVIHSRPDVRLIRPFCVHPVAPNTMYAPFLANDRIDEVCPTGYIQHTPTDQFGYGDMRSMQTVCNFYARALPPTVSPENMLHMHVVPLVRIQYVEMGLRLIRIQPSAAYAKFRRLEWLAWIAPTRRTGSVFDPSSVNGGQLEPIRRIP